MNKAIKLKDKDKNTIYPCPFYPIGSIYISVNNTNPSNYFGGTWEQIQDKFLLCAGSSYKAGTTGGNASHKHTTSGHTLTINEIPSHSHGMTYSYGSGSAYGMVWTNGAYQGPYNPDGLGVVQYTGGNGSHSHGDTGTSNNMPPYLAVYVWKRVA